MMDDERAIRELIDTWMSATSAGDIQAVLSLMTDDVVFLVPTGAPFGKEAFRASLEQMKDVHIQGRNEIEELEVVRDVAYLRCRIEVSVSAGGQPPRKRAGYTLTILRKQGDGRWLLARDANLTAPLE